MPRVRTMPATAYNRTISTIRDYPRMVYEYEQLRQSIGARAASYDGLPKATDGGDGVQDKAIRLADMAAEIEAIREVISQIPEDMRDGILNNIYYGIRYPRNRYGQLVPSLETWKREKSKFVTLVAHKLKIY